MSSLDHRCLIVDDSPAFGLAARRMLEAAGMTVVGTVATRTAALESARLHCPDLILVDIDLGGDSGFDVVEALHQEVFTPAPAIILVSTHDEDDFADLVSSSSALGFLPKFEVSADRIEQMLLSSPRRDR